MFEELKEVCDLFPASIKVVAISTIVLWIIFLLSIKKFKKWSEKH